MLISDSGVIGGNVSGFGSTAVTNAVPVLSYLPLPSRTTTSVQSRAADYVYWSRISLNIRTQFGTAITGDVVLSWMLVLHKTIAGTAVTATTFCADWFGNATPVPESIPNRNNKDVTNRYQILKKGRIMVKETVAGVTENHPWHIEYRKKPIRCSMVLGSAGTTNSCDSNALFLIMYTHQSNGVGATGITSAVEGNIYFRDQV